MSSRTKENTNNLAHRYAAELRAQLVRKSGARSRPAEGLGRSALAAGLDRLDLVRIHEQTLLALLPPAPLSKNSNGMLKRAASFLVDALTPIEIAHLAARNSLKSADRLQPTAAQWKLAFAAPRRQLQREIARREAVQEALKKSEQHYGLLLEKSRRMQLHLRRLSHEILSSHEEERKKISRELHDEVGQTLTAINVKLATLKKDATAGTTTLAKEIASTQRLLEKSMNTVHRFARELRPPQLDDLGLVAALHSFLKDFTKRTLIPVNFRTFAAVEELQSDKRTVLYRVAQESFTNVAKHAHASVVTVGIRRLRGAVLMEIHDNGRGFDVEQALQVKKVGRLGLLGMRERVEMVGGSFSVESAPGSGTTVRAQIPFRTPRPGSQTARKRSKK